MRVEIRPMELMDKNYFEETPSAISDSGTTGAELNPVKNFLSGKNCLSGVSLKFVELD